jgi:hypothetical protein
MDQTSPSTGTLAQQARTEVVTAIVTAQESMSASSQQLSRSVVDLVTRTQQPLALPAAPVLPACVLEYAGQLVPVKNS